MRITIALAALLAVSADHETTLGSLTNTETCRICPCGTYSSAEDANACAAHTTTCGANQKYTYSDATVLSATATCEACSGDTPVQDPDDACACAASATPAPTYNTLSPTDFPTSQPSESPTAEPTPPPSLAPTESPTADPTGDSDAPTQEPTYNTPAPTKFPTAAEESTDAPTAAPTTGTCPAGFEYYAHTAHSDFSRPDTDVKAFGVMVSLIISGIAALFIGLCWRNANVSPDNAKKEADAAASKV